MKKVDNEIQKELSYNYHTAFEADRVINMTEYFDEPPKKSNPFAKLVNTKYEKDDRKKLEQISKLYYYDLFDKYNNINHYPIFVTSIDQEAMIAIFTSNENDGSTKIYYDYHLIGTSTPLVVTLTVNDNTYNINGDNFVGYIQTFEKNEDIKLNISIECNGKKSTFIIEK